MKRRMVYDRGVDATWRATLTAAGTWIALAGLVALLGMGRAGAGPPPGCCVCTACQSPELFACRDALDGDACATICSALSCDTAEFLASTDCLDQAQCYGDCCDDASGGCRQVSQANCTNGGQFFNASYCDASSCIARPPQPDGTPCTVAAECQSGFCVDGVCCHTACDGPQQICDQRGHEGMCVTLPTTPTPIASGGALLLTAALLWCTALAALRRTGRRPRD